MMVLFFIAVISGWWCWTGCVLRSKCVFRRIAYYNENFNGISTICIDWDRWKHTGISNKFEQIHFELTGSAMDDGLDVEMQ